MRTREQVAEAVAREIGARGAKAVEDPWGTGLAVADRLGFDPIAKPAPARGESWLFVRQVDDVPPEVAARFDGVIVAARVYRAGRVRLANQDASWFAAVRAARVRVAVFDWMLPPGTWAQGLAASVAWAKSVGAEAYCLNVEPRPATYPHGRWEGQHDEAALYASTARDLCDRRGLQLWITSWAKPSQRKTFPIREFVRPAHVCIPQPYEVHHPGGSAYVEAVIAEWRGYGAKEVWIGRGAHEIDRSDNDAWRTPAEIAAHRRSTPAGATEVWWPPAGSLARRPAVVAAMVS